jgi:uncharacterized protein YndB with AHSA1/START domain
LAADQDLVITRTFDAPKERVWKAWTDPELVRRWWGPKDFTAPVARIDLRVGGSYLFCMQAPDGKDFWSTGVYREVLPPRRLVCTDSFSDERGNVVPATHYGMGADFPRELLMTVIFEDRNGMTEMTLKHAGMPAATREDARQSWEGSFGKLAASLKL